MDIKEAATRKIGPLPAYAWGGILGGALLAYKALNGGGSGASSPFVQPIAGGSDIDFDSGSGGGGGGGSAGGGGSVTPTPTTPVPTTPTRPRGNTPGSRTTGGNIPPSQPPLKMVPGGLTRAIPPRVGDTDYGTTAASVAVPLPGYQTVVTPEVLRGAGDTMMLPLPSSQLVLTPALLRGAGNTTDETIPVGILRAKQALNALYGRAMAGSRIPTTQPTRRRDVIDAAKGAGAAVESAVNKATPVPSTKS